MKMYNKDTRTIVHQDLVAACKMGKHHAQMELYKLYYKAMYNTSLQIVGEATEAEDIMQESFLKAFQLLPKTELESGFGGWMKKIVVNKSLDAVRKKKLFFEPVEEVKDETVLSDSLENNGDSLTDKISKIKSAMTLLPEKYRIVLSLNLLEGYDHAEISGILGITTSTSRAQLSRGKQKLLKLLAN
jgi:RNA polymerase sigma factor (sigma-70 family)